MTASTTPNAELAYRALDAIDADPKAWDQGVWIKRDECGTAACFAGWACLLSGDNPVFDEDDVTTGRVVRGQDDYFIPRRAAQLLGVPIDAVFSRWNAISGPPRLFDPRNTREDLGRMVAEIFGPRPGGNAS